MDLRHLKPDELEFELSLRGLGGSSNAVQNLEQRISAENRGAFEEPRDTHRITRQSVAQEVKECDVKLTEVFEAVRIAMGEADDGKVVVAQSRLVHVAGRVKRLKLHAPEHAGVDRVVARLREIEHEVVEIRDSFGAGAAFDENNQPLGNAGVLGDQQQQLVSDVPPPMRLNQSGASEQHGNGGVGPHVLGAIPQSIPVRPPSLVSQQLPRSSDGPCETFGGFERHVPSNRFMASRNDLVNLDQLFADPAVC